jgi:hypothetical protein
MDKYKNYLFIILENHQFKSQISNINKILGIIQKYNIEADIYIKWGFIQIDLKLCNFQILEELRSFCLPLKEKEVYSIFEKLEKSNKFKDTNFSSIKENKNIEGAKTTIYLKGILELHISESNTEKALKISQNHNIIARLTFNSKLKFTKIKLNLSSFKIEELISFLNEIKLFCIPLKDRTYNMLKQEKSVYIDGNLTLHVSKLDTRKILKVIKKYNIEININLKRRGSNQITYHGNKQKEIEIRISLILSSFTPLLIEELTSIINEFKSYCIPFKGSYDIHETSSESLFENPFYGPLDQQYIISKILKEVK